MELARWRHYLQHNCEQLEEPSSTHERVKEKHFHRHLVFYNFQGLITEEIALLLVWPLQVRYHVRSVEIKAPQKNATGNKAPGMKANGMKATQTKGTRSKSHHYEEFSLKSKPIIKEDMSYIYCDRYMCTKKTASSNRTQWQFSNTAKFKCSVS